MDTTKFQQVPIDKLVPYARNARTHSKEQIAQLRASLREFGFVSPAVIDSDYNILVGHGRVQAAREEGYKTVPCVFAENLTDAQKKAYIIADNQLALNAGWDADMLSVELSDLQGQAFDLDLLGFDAEDLGKYLNAGEEGQQDDFDVDEELEKPCFSKEGDIWHLGKHTVICGDSTDPEVYNTLLGDVKVNLVCTDPPYMVSLDSASGKIKNDDLNDKDAYDFLMKAFTATHGCMAADASIYCFYATMKARIFYDAFEDAGFKVGAGLIWRKPRAPLMRTDWKFNMEPIIFGWRKDGKHKWYGDQKQKAVFDFDGITNSKKDGFGHPSSKPVPLIAYLLSQSSSANGVVLDSFLGSATTLIACEQLGRICYGIELEPKFVDVAVRRYQATAPTGEIYLLRDGKKMTLDDALAEIPEETAAVNT
jgi:DNA modification methylase